MLGTTTSQAPCRLSLVSSPHLPENSLFPPTRCVVRFRRKSAVLPPSSGSIRCTLIRNWGPRAVRRTRRNIRVPRRQCQVQPRLWGVWRATQCPVMGSLAANVLRDTISTIRRRPSPRLVFFARWEGSARAVAQSHAKNALRVSATLPVLITNPCAN